MSLYEDLIYKTKKLAVVGLGYVGIPLAVELSKYVDVIGYDLNEDKINKYKKGIDPTNEVGNEAIEKSTIKFTNNKKGLEEAKFYIVAVPTPINIDKSPDLKPVISASKIVGESLTKGDIVVYESTVYPGVTEDVCISILESESGLKCGIDFKIGYSPERINPGDKEHRLENIVKVVSGIDEESLDTIAKVYGLIISVGIYKAPSIKVAEASKIVENCQRDINIAFMNELSIIFDLMDIDIGEVLKASKTKWNFLDFHPGLVGGHCIGVDPYYLIYISNQLGYHSRIISSGRDVNDDMVKYVEDKIIRALIESDKKVQGSKIAILGVTFKPNCKDIRNSKILELIKMLQKYKLDIKIIDPIVDESEIKKEYNLEVTRIEECRDIDIILGSVAHNDFFNITLETLDKIASKYSPAVIDIMNIFNKEKLIEKGYKYYSL